MVSTQSVNWDGEQGDNGASLDPGDSIVSDGGCLALTLLTGEETLQEQVLSVRKANP